MGMQLNCRLTGMTPGGSERYEVWNTIPARQHRAFALSYSMHAPLSSVDNERIGP